MVQVQRKWYCSAHTVLLCGCGNDTRSPGHCGDRLVTWLFLHFWRSEGAPAIYMLLEIKPEKPEIFMYKWHIEHLKNICLFLQIISRPISMWCTTYMCVIIFVMEILSSLVLFGFLKLPLCWLDDAAALHKLILKHWLCSNTFRIITSWNFDQPLVWYIIIRWLFMNCHYFVNSICSFKVIITSLLRHGGHLSNVNWSHPNPTFWNINRYFVIPPDGDCALNQSKLSSRGFLQTSCWRPDEAREGFCRECCQVRDRHTGEKHSGWQCRQCG